MKRKVISIENGIVSIPKCADIWMTQYELADLFQCFVSKIHTNIRVILKIGVPDENNVCQRHHYKNGGFVEQYNLEMITALAFRIKSKNAEIFREWLMKRAVTNTAPRPILIIGSRDDCCYSLN